MFGENVAFNLSYALNVLVLSFGKICFSSTKHVLIIIDI